MEGQTLDMGKLTMENQCCTIDNMQACLLHKVKLFSATTPVAAKRLAEVVVGNKSRLLSKTNIQYCSEVIVRVSSNANAIAIANVDGSSKAWPVGEVYLGHLRVNCLSYPGKVQLVSLWKVSVFLPVVSWVGQVVTMKPGLGLGLAGLEPGVEG